MTRGREGHGDGDGGGDGGGDCDGDGDGDGGGGGDTMFIDQQISRQNPGHRASNTQCAQRVLRAAAIAPQKEIGPAGGGNQNRFLFFNDILTFLLVFPCPDFVQPTPKNSGRGYLVPRFCWHRPQIWTSTRTRTSQNM